MTSSHGLVIWLCFVLISIIPCRADWLYVLNTGEGGISVGQLDCMHEDGSSEGYDGNDFPEPPWPPGTKALSVITKIGEHDLILDSRPLESESLFEAELAVSDSSSGGISGLNRLYFSIEEGDTNRLYTARIHVDGAWTTGGTNFDSVVDVRSVADAGGYVDLPTLTNVPSGTAYGTLDVSCRFVQRPGIEMEKAECSDTGITSWVVYRIQPGLTMTNVVYFSPSMSSPAWIPVGTNALGYLVPTLDNFNDVARYTNGVVTTNSVSEGYFRVGARQTIP